MACTPTAKAEAQRALRRALSSCWPSKSHWLHRELATPRGFAGPPLCWQHRRHRIAGPFGLASRSPLAGLWLCGDAIYPGEGTAGVSLSAEMAVRQLLAQRNVGQAAGRGQRLLQGRPVLTLHLLSQALQRLGG